MDNKKIIIFVGVAVVAAGLLGFLIKGKNKDSASSQGIVEVIEQAPSSSAPSAASSNAQQLYLKAQSLKKDRNLEESRQVLKQIIDNHIDFEQIDQVQKEYENVNMEIVLSNIPTEDAVVHEVAAGDTLGKLAKQYGTTVQLIKKSNNLKSDVIRLGQKLRIWNKPFNIFVDKSQNILILKKGEEVVKIYTVSTGENNSTPVGAFKVTTKLVDPVWFNRGVIVPPESPSNVLGTRWLGFDIPGYGIHGTTSPDTIGRQETAGCVRMRNYEVEELYDIIPIGTVVTIVD